MEMEERDRKEKKKIKKRTYEEKNKIPYWKNYDVTNEQHKQ